MLSNKLFPSGPKQAGWYIFWISPWIIILLLSTVLTGYAAPPPAQVPTASNTVKPVEGAGDTLPEATSTPTPTGTGEVEAAGTAETLFPANTGLILYLPLIVKSPPLLCTFDIGASDCVFFTPTPTNTPFGTPPGFGTPTNTPEPTPTKPPEPTNTPTVFFRLLENGDFEDGPDEGWDEFSSGGFPVIIEDNADDLPTLPISPFEDWAAWLGGADNEHTYIRQTVTVPGGGLYLSYRYYIQSYDVCGSELIPPRLFDRGGIKINGQDITGDFPGCTHELCEPKDDAREWRTAVVSTLPFGGPGATITVEFWAITDATRTSSLFIDNVAFINDPEVVITTTSANQNLIRYRNPSDPLGQVYSDFYKRTAE